MASRSSIRRHVTLTLSVPTRALAGVVFAPPQYGSKSGFITDLLKAYVARLPKSRRRPSRDLIRSRADSPRAAAARLKTLFPELAAADAAAERRRLARAAVRRVSP